MPIYEYRCDECGHTFEVFQRFSDDPVTSCEDCGGPVQRVFHPVAIHFKGSGFYTTDYGRSSSKRGAPGGGETAADSAAVSKDDGAKAAKPAADKSTGGDKAKEKAN